MNLSFSLYRLQMLDTQRLKIKRRLAAITETLAADESVRAKLELKTQAEQSLRKVQSDLNESNNQVASKKMKLELTQSQLFGGKVRNPKELQDLQAESEALRKTIAKMEDDLLDVMIRQESAQKSLQEAEKEYSRILDQKASENALLSGEKHNLELEKPRLDAQRQSLVAALPLDIAAEYQNLFRSKGGKAVSEIVDDACSACGASISPGDIQAARSPSTLVKCRTCGRYLYKS